MRIVLVAAGFHGDTLPFIPLGLGLQRAGHEVTVVCARALAGIVAADGVPAVPYDWGPDAVEPALLHAWHGDDERAQMEVLAQLTREITHAAFEPLREAFRTHDAAVVGPLLAPAAQQLRERHRVSMAVLMHTPVSPTTHGDSVIGTPDSGRRLRYLLDGAKAGLALGRATGAGARVVAERLGVRPLSTARHAARFVRTPTFTAVSRFLAPGNAGNRRAPATGYLLRSSNDPLSDRVEAFLGAGDPPVLFGLGSATTAASRRAAELVLDAVIGSGRRVIAPRAAGVDGSRYPSDRVLLIDFEPFQRLFPRCHLVIHHGGVGTEALAFVSDVPQFITPLTIDQRYFGRRAHELGVAPPPVHLQHLDDAAVRSAIGFAGRPEVRARAAHLGRLVREEDGVGNAVRFLTRTLHLAR